MAVCMVSRSEPQAPDMSVPCPLNGPRLRAGGMGVSSLAHRASMREFSTIRYLTGVARLPDLEWKVCLWAIDAYTGPRRNGGNHGCRVTLVALFAECAGHPADGVIRRIARTHSPGPLPPWPGVTAPGLEPGWRRSSRGRVSRRAT